MKYKNILLVDDDKDIQELVGFFLKQAGFIVRVAQDGFSALTELNENHYDLVLLDISMPYLNGFTVLKSLRATPKFKNLPVIMLTGSQEKADQEKAQDEVSDYIVKPPKRDDLLNSIERILGGRPQYEELRFRYDDPMAEGAFLVPLRLLSISRNGIIVQSPVAVEKDFEIHLSQIGLFRNLELQQKQCKVMDCIANENGTYEYFISFIGLSLADQERIHTWLMEQVFFERKVA
jgi:DNA-binding response OmpR family regulator